MTLVEYGDFECPYCGVAYPAVKALEEKYGDRLRVVFRSFPLAQHPHAQAAAEAAEFAADHGKFWEMHDTLYEHQRALDERHLLGYARGPRPRRRRAGEGAARANVRGDRRGAEARAARRAAIPGTPAFFLNDVLFEDEPTARASRTRSTGCWSTAVPLTD